MTINARTLIVLSMATTQKTQHPLTDEALLSGRLSRYWREGCRANETEDQSLEDWIRIALNDTAAELDASGCVYSRGAYLSQHHCDELMRAIDRGV